MLKRISITMMFLMGIIGQVQPSQTSTFNLVNPSNLTITFFDNNNNKNSISIDKDVINYMTNIKSGTYEIMCQNTTQGVDCAFVIQNKLILRKSYCINISPLTYFTLEYNSTTATNTQNNQTTSLTNTTSSISDQIMIKNNQVARLNGTFNISTTVPNTSNSATTPKISSINFDITNSEKIFIMFYDQNQDPIIYRPLTISAEAIQNMYQATKGTYSLNCIPDQTSENYICTLTINQKPYTFSYNKKESWIRGDAYGFGIINNYYRYNNSPIATINNNQLTGNFNMATPTYPTSTTFDLKNTHNFNIMFYGKNKNQLNIDTLGIDQNAWNSIQNSTKGNYSLSCQPDSFFGAICTLNINNNSYPISYDSYQTENSNYQNIYGFGIQYNDSNDANYESTIVDINSVGQITGAFNYTPSNNPYPTSTIFNIPNATSLGVIFYDKNKTPLNSTPFNLTLPKSTGAYQLACQNSKGTITVIFNNITTNVPTQYSTALGFAITNGTLTSPIVAMNPTGSRGNQINVNFMIPEIDLKGSSIADLYVQDSNGNKYGANNFGNIANLSTIYACLSNSNEPNQSYIYFAYPYDNATGASISFPTAISTANPYSLWINKQQVATLNNSTASINGCSLNFILKNIQ